jgi:hypothetical protein
MRISTHHLVPLWAAALLGLNLSTAPSSADATPAEWVALYESPPTRAQTPFDYVAALTTDGEGNVYSAITGEDDEGDDHIVVVKYEPAGVVQWTNSFKGGNRTTADEITLDHAGNVYVAGVDRNSIATPGNPATGADIVTLKFDPEGALLWTAHYAQPSSDAPEAIAVNAAGQVYVTGYSYNETNTLDYVTIKYDLDGTELWVRRFDGAAGNDDRPSDLALDRRGNVLVTGATTDRCYLGNDGDEECYTDITTLKYSPEGDLIWERTFDGPTGGSDRGNALAIDRFGNIHVAGISVDTSYDSRWVTIKYSPRGRKLWTRFTNDNEDFESPSAVAVNRRGQVYVAGGAEFSVVKYNRRGRREWNRNPLSGRISGIAFDQQGNLCVGGRTFDEVGNGIGFGAVKLDSAGNLLWCGEWIRNTGGRQISLSAAFTAQGDIYVGGYSFGTPHGDPAAATVKFSPPLTAPLPTVTIYALDPIAHEGSGKRSAGAFLLRRRGSTENELTVPYQVGGNAENGVDYEALSGEVTIPAGSSRAIIMVNPIDDPEIESTERVELQLQAGDEAPYRLGRRDRATVYILDDDRHRMPWHWWWHGKGTR